ncbi:hypothetical protein GCT13_04050 [Paraburkholderia sp. CNPSo 3157]|uniref:Uncharacterized protein n=1 Tax=Paraburkholderia franconis TaxID=2654983 RepID=A0A7X1N694_9BURK|nr:hypothetical protein [Paraburkholderia franconis]MPW16119.1 hypothetical protein [Paraburkholderia franconis]
MTKEKSWRVFEARMFVFETLMNVYEKVKFDSTQIGARFRTLVARMPRPDDTFGNQPTSGLMR